MEMNFLDCPPPPFLGNKRLQSCPTEHCRALPAGKILYPAEKIVLTASPSGKMTLTSLEIHMRNPEPHWKNLITLLERQMWQFIPCGISVLNTSSGKIDLFAPMNIWSSAGGGGTDINWNSPIEWLGKNGNLAPIRGLVKGPPAVLES